MKWGVYTLILLIVVWGVGCILVDQDPPIDPPEPVAEATFLGLVEAADAETQHVLVVLPEGGVEDVALPESISAGQSLVGTLVEISGQRDLSSRIVLAGSLTMVSESDGLQLVTPEPFSKIISPLVISGFVRAGEPLEWHIRDFSEQELSSGSVFVSGTVGEFTPLRLEIFLPSIKNQDFSVTLVFGGKIKKIPLSLLSTKSDHIQTFYSRPDAPNGSCDRVYPVLREISQTPALARAAGIELLSGPTIEEQEAGYRTALSPDIGLNSLTLLQGVVTIDLIDTFNSLRPGTCSYQTAIAQINETLMKIEGVSEVHILINGQE